MSPDAESNKSAQSDIDGKGRDEALRSLGGANVHAESLSADIASGGERVLDDLAHQINSLGEQCPEELKAARLEIERTLADARQTLSEASGTIESLRKHLRDR